VARAAADARKAPGAAWHATRTRELAAGTTTDAWYAALAARTAAGATVLAAGATVAVGVAATATRVLLEDNMSGCTDSCWTGGERFSCGHRANSNRCSHSPAHHQRFDQVEFR
jgi:hypothetical protein